MAKISPAKPLLILLYGYPGAGKTYFARQLCENLQAAHLHGDRIRGELFEKPRRDQEEDAIVAQLMDYMAAEFLSAGVSVVYDVNVARFSQRRLLRDTARHHHAEPVLVWFQIDADTSFARASRRDRRRADDKFAEPLDKAAFDRLAGAMQNPEQGEDYVVVSGKHAFSTQLAALWRRLRELALLSISSNEVDSRVVKPGLVNLIPNPAAGRVDLARRKVIIR